MRIRTITAGISLRSDGDLAPVRHAIEFLLDARKTYVESGYEVQTLRLAADTWLAALDRPRLDAVLPMLIELDALISSHGLVASIGPVNAALRATDLAQWADQLVRKTRNLSFSTAIATPRGGVDDAAARAAAAIIVSLSRSLPDGLANFRYAAAANIPAGTPFFPVAWHEGPPAFAIGCESASVVEEAYAAVREVKDATTSLVTSLDRALEPVESIATRIAARHDRSYLGIDTSPAPLKDRSIGAAIEALTRAPFGDPGTLQACAATTAALKAVKVRTCGYSGLMLPVLEDPVLALRAGERRFRVRDLLLFSSVCGTGLDVVPLPGDTSEPAIAATLRDVAALATRLSKPLSARLFLCPGKKAGDMARFDDPVLTDSVVMQLD